MSDSIEKLEAALSSILEYWNGSRTDGAMFDALEVIEQRAHEALSLLSEVKANFAELEAFRDAVIGWRENDWPEGFSRRTAELVAQNAVDRALGGGAQ